ncbi:PadR family transcriptional regulator [Janibacter limosus]|uniref:PadR family transcriptional regulator n=1 Tax=Janibacter limosus TaxID=53458 RepID=A0AC61U2L8_9MICO|nr:PadR family transcriptional regulator [Janibacter limosus]UUZ44103.1 PadR family transcriptional regulator [Janibacter limosus]
MTTGHVLMGLLSRGPQHGYDLKRHHDELLPAARPMAFGQVYAALGRLAGKGLVTRVATEQDSGPERVVYELTPAGRAEVGEWAAEADGPGDHVANPLATKIAVALLVGGEPAAVAFLRRQRTAHLERMRVLTRDKREAKGDLHRVLAADYALSHLDADVRWMEDALERVHDLEGDR